MGTRTDRVQVIFEVGNDGKLKASLVDIGKAGGDAALGLDKASEAQDRMLKAARNAGYVLGTGLAAVMGLIIKNTMEAERVDAQLEARLKSTASAAGLTKQALDDLATSTARKTTFDDESVKSAEALLLTFTKIHSDVFPKTIAVIADMAVAMGTDLEGATLQVGKALNDPIQGITALQRVGVSFTADQKELIKSLVETGRASEAQGLILRELETEFGGAAEAARGTFGGALTGLKNTLDDLTEGQGGSLDAATEAVNDLTATLNDPDVQAGFSAIVSGVASVSAEVVQGIALLATYLQRYNDIAGLGNGSKAPGDASDRALNNRLAAISNTKAAVKNGGLAGLWSAVYAPDAALGLGDIFKTKDELLGQLQQEATSIIREMTRRNSASLLDAGLTAGFDFIEKGGSTNGGNAGGNPSAGGKSGGKKAAIDAEATARQRLAQQVAQAIADSDREIALMSIDQAHREELTRLYDVQNGKMREASQQDKDAYVQKGRELDLARQLELMRKREIEQEEAAANAKREAQQATQDVIDDLQFELQLLGLGNAEREREIVLRRAGAAATEEQRARIDDLLGQLRGAQELDAYKSDLKGLFVDIGMDIGHAEDAVEQFFDTLKRRALQALADNLIDKLFSSQSGAGASGGWMSAIGSVLGSLFGGGRASGGSVSGSHLYEVAERGQPEVFEQNGRRYLIPGGDGWVTPAVPVGGAAPAGAGGAGGYGAVTINNYGNPNDVRTEERTGPGGMRELLVFVQETAVNAVAADVQKGGKVAKAGQGAYGWQRQGVVRG